MSALAIIASIVALLALLGWAGAARRARMLADHLQSARALLRRQEQAIRQARPAAEIIPFRRDPPPPSAA